ncbi:MAG: type II secretion system F family protein [Desulfovibrio sp.]|nr:type II secretion system F family protein [Desulfovibrio sp.]
MPGPYDEPRPFIEKGFFSASRLARLFFTPALRAKTWRKMAFMLRHGISFYGALLSLESQYRRAGSLHAGVLAVLRERVANGLPFSVALGDVAGPDECMLIRAGEERSLAEGLLLASECLMKKNLLRRRLGRALLYPFFLLLLLLGLLVLSALVLVPGFSAVLPPEEWTGEAALLLRASRFVTGPFFLPFVFTLLFLTGLFFFSLPRLTGPLRRLLDRLFPWSVYRSLIGSGWLLSLSTLIRSGKSLRDSVEALSLLPSLSPYLRERSNALAGGLAAGKTMGEALLDAGFLFPSREVVFDLLLYARLSNFEEELHGISEESMEACLEECEESLRLLSVLLLFLVTVAVFFILMALSSLEMGLAAL